MFWSFIVEVSLLLNYKRCPPLLGICLENKKHFFKLDFIQIASQIEPIKGDFAIKNFKSVCHCIDTNSEIIFWSCHKAWLLWFGWNWKPATQLSAFCHYRVCVIILRVWTRLIFLGVVNVISRGKVVLESQAKLVTHVMKGKSVAIPLTESLPRLAFFADKRFSSCYKLAQHWRHRGNFKNLNKWRHWFLYEVIFASLISFIIVNYTNFINIFVNIFEERWPNIN